MIHYIIIIFIHKINQKNVKINVNIILINLIIILIIVQMTKHVIMLRMKAEFY